MLDTPNVLQFTHIFGKCSRVQRRQKSPKFAIKKLVSALMLSGALSSTASAQTVTTYSYDTLGRLIEASADSGDSEAFEHDEAGNITRAQRGTIQSSNQPPTCTGTGLHSASSQLYSIPVLSNCSDPDGDTISISSATVTSGQAFASIFNGFVNVSGIDNWEYVEVDVVVSDSFGNSTTVTHGIAGPTGGGGPPPF